MVRQKAEKLSRFSDRIVDCHVVIEASNHRHHQGNLFDVRINLKVPGSEIVGHSGTQHEHAHEDAHVAISSAFERVTRQLEDQARLQRGEVKHHEPKNKNMN
jgi:ribosomal subunit interface protein